MELRLARLFVPVCYREGLARMEWPSGPKNKGETMNRIIATIPFDDAVLAKAPMSQLMRELLERVAKADENFAPHLERQYRAVAGVLAAIEAGDVRLS